MKQRLLYALLFLSVIVLSFKNKMFVEKKYTVSLTKDEWSSLLVNIQNSNVMVRTCSYPGSQIAQVQDTAIKYQQLIQEQLIPQINADSVKSKK